MSAIHYIARPWLTRGATTVGYEVDGMFQPIAECSGLGRLIEEAERTAAQIAAALNGNVALAASHQRLKEALERIAAIEDRMVGGDWEEIEEARGIARAALKDAP